MFIRDDDGNRHWWLDHPTDEQWKVLNARTAEYPRLVQFAVVAAFLALLLVAVSVIAVDLSSVARLIGAIVSIIVILSLLQFAVWLFGQPRNNRRRKGQELMANTVTPNRLSYRLLMFPSLLAELQLAGCGVDRYLKCRIDCYFRDAVEADSEDYYLAKSDGQARLVYEARYVAGIAEGVSYAGLLSHFDQHLGRLVEADRSACLDALDHRIERAQIDTHEIQQGSERSELLRNQLLGQRPLFDLA